VIVLTSYFCRKPHPQLGDPDIVGVQKDGRVKSDYFSYIQDWYESLVENKVRGVVFYDTLSDEFVKEYTNEYISFEKVGEFLYTNNDYRFFCYLNFLRDKAYTIVCLTDCSDVVMVNDPTTLLEEGSWELFFCKDIHKLHYDPFLRIHKRFGWSKLNYFIENIKVFDLLNMGVIGGKYENIMNFLELFCKERTKMRELSYNANMPLGQYIARLNFKAILCGAPFTSEYKKYQTNRADVCFRHK